jgi:hypothetical protein
MIRKLKMEKQKRRRVKHTRSFIDRLTTHADSIRDKAASLPNGKELDAVLEKLEQTERAVEISRWLSAAELKPPRMSGS